MNSTWTRAEQVRACKESHEIFPLDVPLPRRFTFTPSYEKEPPAMSLLLGWEYGRLWLKEHHETMHKQLTSEKPVFIEPDFNWWVNKRTVAIDRRQIFMKKKKQNPHEKNCNLSAFAGIKVIRQKRNHGGDDKAARSAPMTDAEKAKKCKCKECKKRRCTGGALYKKQSMVYPWY